MVFAHPIVLHLLPILHLSTCLKPTPEHKQNTYIPDCVSTQTTNDKKTTNKEQRRKCSKVFQCIDNDTIIFISFF